MKLNLLMRHKVFVFDDPMRRCYNGAYGKHHYEWSSWETLHSNIDKEKGKDIIEYWENLNDFAVSQRGESAKKEFKLIEVC